MMVLFKFSSFAHCHLRDIEALGCRVFEALGSRVFEALGSRVFEALQCTDIEAPQRRDIQALQRRIGKLHSSTHKGSQQREVNGTE